MARCELAVIKVSITADLVGSYILLWVFPQVLK